MNAQLKYKKKTCVITTCFLNVLGIRQDRPTFLILKTYNDLANGVIRQTAFTKLRHIHMCRKPVNTEKFSNHFKHSYV